jgi:hypothetical protein
LQKSKIAGLLIFRESTKRKTIADSITSIALPKLPMNLTREDVSPHVFTRKSRLWLAEFLITDAKRLLQQYQVTKQTSANDSRISANDLTATLDTQRSAKTQPRPPLVC